MIDLIANCVGHWKMNDNADNTIVADSGHNGINGYSNQRNTSARTTEGKVKSALHFGYTYDAIWVDDNPAFDWTTKMSAFGWIRPSVITGEKALFGKYKTGTAEREWLLLQNAQKLKVWFGDSNGNYTGYWASDDNVITATNVWYFVGLIFDGTLAEANRCKLFVNGDEKAGSKNGTIPSSLNAETARFSFGDYDGGAKSWYGRMDNVMIFDKALTVEEIIYLHNHGLGSKKLKSSARSLVGGSLAQNSLIGNGLI